MDPKILSILFKYGKIIFLPLFLAVLFVIQNLAFNVWLNLYSEAYIVRLLLASFALGIILYGPALFITPRGASKRKYKYTYLFFISFIISIIFVAQFLYYRYSQSFLQFSAIKYFGQTISVFGTIKTLITLELILFFTNIITILVSFILTFRKKYTEETLLKWEKISIGIVMVIIILFGYQYLLHTEKKEWGDSSRLYKKVYDLRTLVGKIGIINFFIEDAFKYTVRSNLVTADDKEFLKIWSANISTSIKDNESSKKFFGAEKGKNLIIIKVESLENVVINKTISGQEITPNLNKLAKEGLYFNNYYAQISQGNTADAEFSILNSLYPLPDDVAFSNYAKNTYKALPQLLVDNGYKTYSMIGDVPTFWNRSNIYPKLGYQKAFGLSDFVVTRSVGQGPSDLGDEDLFSQALPKLETFKQPFMATIITMSSHTPFILPIDLQKLKIAEKTNLTETQWGYMQSIHYVDKAIGDFIENLKKAGLYDNSLIIIVGDHGSFQNIYSALSQDNLKADQETIQLYKNLDVGVVNGAKLDENILPELQNNQVPMIILSSKTNLKGINNIPASHIDIYPTIANLFGIDAPKTVLGQDLLNTKTPVETHFKFISGGIDAILTDKLAYQADKNGIFENGSCISIPNRKSLPIIDCQDLYNQQTNTLKASNIIIRGNLLNFYSENLK